MSAVGKAFKKVGTGIWNGVKKVGSGIVTGAKKLFGGGSNQEQQIEQAPAAVPESTPSPSFGAPVSMRGDMQAQPYDNSYGGHGNGYNNSYNNGNGYNSNDYGGYDNSYGGMSRFGGMGRFGNFGGFGSRPRVNININSGFRGMGRFGGMGGYGGMGGGYSQDMSTSPMVEQASAPAMMPRRRFGGFM